MAPQYAKSGELGRRDGKGQSRTVRGRGDEVLGRWGMVTPVVATGLWKALSSHLGEVVTPAVSCTVPQDVEVNRAHSKRLVLMLQYLREGIWLHPCVL